MALSDNNEIPANFPMNRSISGKGLPSNGMDADAQIEAVRESILDEIDAAKSLIHQQINLLRSTQQDFEMDDAISQLENQLRHLNSQAFSASTGNIATLISLSRTMPTLAANNARVSALAHTEAAYQSATIIFEMTDHQISYYQAQHDKQATAFTAYEQHSAGQIEKLAATNGVDISAYRDNREQLLKEKEEAKAKSDRLGMFKADALLAANNYQAGIIVGKSPEETASDAKEADAAKQRYLKEVEMKARQEAKEAGMAPAKAIDHIAQSRLAAETDLNKRVDQLAKSNGVVTTQDKATTVKDDATAKYDLSKKDDGKSEKTKVKDESDLFSNISLDDSPDADQVTPPPTPNHTSKSGKHL